MLLEALGQTLATGHVLLHTARDAAVLALGHGLGGEVADAGGEAVVDEVAEELCGSGWKVSDLCCRYKNWRLL